MKRQIPESSHVKNCVNQGITNIHIRSGDTDVLVLAVSVCSKLPSLEGLWVDFGTGKHFKVIDALGISRQLGPEKSTVLPLFHSFTGCDTVSSFAGKGKRTAWATWRVYPEVTKAFSSLIDNPKMIAHSEATVTLEKFVVLLYDRTSNKEQVNDARRQLFSLKAGLENIPPS